MSHIIDWATMWAGGIEMGYINNYDRPNEHIQKLNGIYGRRFFMGTKEYFIQPQTFTGGDKTLCMILVAPNNASLGLGLILYRVLTGSNNQLYVSDYTVVSGTCSCRLQGRGLVITPGEWSDVQIIAPSNHSYTVEGGYFGS